MSRHSKSVKQAADRDPTQGRFRGKLPVIKGRLTVDEVDSMTERTQPIGVVKEFREKGY